MQLVRSSNVLLRFNFGFNNDLCLKVAPLGTQFKQPDKDQPSPLLQCLPRHSKKSAHCLEGRRKAVWLGLNSSDAPNLFLLPSLNHKLSLFWGPLHPLLAL